MKSDAALICLLAMPLTAHPDAGLQERTDAVLRESFATASPQEWATRARQDEVQALCSRYRNQPPPAVAQRIAASQRRAIRYPAGGTLMGEWSRGEALAASGSGGHIGRIQPDPPGTRQGGNCYACHLLAPTELAAGTIGPSLTGYAERRGTSPESIKQVYEKIYNPQAFFPCSVMPRFGHNHWLTPDEIADLVAFLLDPSSPVNK